jgi:ParB-like chromosome segregation protein Spo0J
MSEEAAAEWVDIGRLHEWADNPRINDGEPVEAVAKSIQRLGWGAPIVARTNGEIIAGHTRYKAALKLGLDRVPVRFVDLDPADAKLMALADNRLNEKARWDMPSLQAIMSEFSFDDVEIAGWDSSDLDRMAGELTGLREDLSEEGSSGDQTGQLKESFCVLIECTSEGEQLEVLTIAEAHGWSTRALV